MSIFWDGQLVADILNPANNTLPNSSSSGMVQYDFLNLIATSSSTILEIHGRQDPAAIFFDDFSVQAVPEPETSAMLLAGLGLMGFTLRRRKMA